MEPIIRGIYVIHITLADLLEQAEAAQATAGNVQAFVEWYASYEYHAGIPADLSSMINVAWVQPTAGIVHAGRLLVERVSLLAGDIEARKAVVATRGRQAVELVSAALHARGLLPARGQLLAPGLRQDLQRIRTSHDLWTWEIGDRHDPLTWQLIAA